MLLLAVSMQTFSHAAVLRGGSELDSISIRSKERTDRFYDSLHSKTTRRALPRFLYNAVFVKTNRDSLKSARVVDESEIIAPYQGRTIGEIVIMRDNVFDQDGNWLERAVNNSRIITRERVIRRDLLFKSGDKLDPREIINNKQLLRSRSYISDVEIEITPQKEDSTVVDIFVHTRDSWTLSADANVNLGRRSMVELYDANLLGFGNRLSVQTNFDWSNGEYGGNEVSYDIPNILGTFFKGNFVFGKSFDKDDIGFAIQHNFLLPTDFEIGVSYYDRRKPYYMLYADTALRVDMRQLDLWAGYSHQIKPINSSIYGALRYGTRRFDARPEVNPRFNPAFHESNYLLGSLGIYREKFLTANLIYGFGYKEYLASGYRAEVLTGYTWGEFSNDWYLGLSYRMGGFTRAGYFMGTFTLGSYIDPVSGTWNQSGFDAAVYGFSNLLPTGRSRLRQFFSLSYTIGWNRLNGADELIEFTEERGPRGLNEHILGLNRLVLNTETVLFTPLQPLGFRVALFGFADAGFIGRDSNIFRNEFCTTFGLGIRLKNERLVFNTIQIKLGLAVGKNGLFNNQYFNISNEQRINKFRYLPTRPETVEFR